MSCNGYVQLTQPSTSSYFDNSQTLGEAYDKHEGTDELFTGRTYGSDNFSVFFWIKHTSKAPESDDDDDIM